MTSQNFSSKFGSLEILKVSSRWGFISLWLQTRCTVLLLTLASRAIERTLHRTRPFAGRVALSTIKGSKRFFPPEVALYGLFQAHPSVLLFRSHQSALTTYRPIPYCIQAFLLPLFRTYPPVEAGQFSRENDPRLMPSCPAPNGQVQELLPRSLVAAKSGGPSPEHSRYYVIVTSLRDSTLVTRARF